MSKTSEKIARESRESALAVAARSRVFITKVTEAGYVKGTIRYPFNLVPFNDPAEEETLFTLDVFPPAEAEEPSFRVFGLLRSCNIFSSMRLECRRPVVGLHPRLIKRLTDNYRKLAPKLRPTHTPQGILEMIRIYESSFTGSGKETWRVSMETVARDAVLEALLEIPVPVVIPPFAGNKPSSTGYLFRSEFLPRSVVSWREQDGVVPAGLERFAGFMRELAAFAKRPWEEAGRFR